MTHVPYYNRPYNKHTELASIILYSREGWWKPLHKYVAEALHKYHQPKDWQLLVLEMPSVPEDSDPTRVAYWQSEQKQAKNLRTVTSLGKYLRRHFPQMPDHTIRDFVALAAPAKYEIWTGVDNMIKAVQEGPGSCMKWDEDEGYDTHPYEVYAERFGWAVAVRLQGTTIMGRCVVNTESKVYVRSYGRDEHEGRSQDDFALEAWLDDQGYKEKHRWPEGVKFAKIEHRDSWLMPYLDADGEQGRRVAVRGSYIVRDDDGEFVCDNTNGEMTEDPIATCDECGDSVDEDDTTYVDATEQRVCSHCLSNRFTHVRGTRESNQGRVSWYYVPNSDAVAVGDTYYDQSNLPSFIVALYDGEYAHEDEAVWVESENEYYRDSECSRRKNGNSLVVVLENGDYELRESAAYCEHNDEWYLSDDCREFDDGKFCLLEDVDEYLAGLSEDELREKLDDEEVEKVMASDEWVYAVNQQQEAQEPLPLPLPVPEPVLVSAPKPVPVPEPTPAYTCAAPSSSLVHMDLADIEARILALREKLPTNPRAVVDEYTNGLLYAMGVLSTGRMTPHRPEVTFNLMPPIVLQPTDAVRIQISES